MKIVRALCAVSIFALVTACMGPPYDRIARQTASADFLLREEVRRARDGDKGAQLALGVRYETGTGVPLNCNIAKRLYAEAAATTGGTSWVYAPQAGKSGQAKVIPVAKGIKQSGLSAANIKLAQISSCKEKQQ